MDATGRKGEESVGGGQGRAATLRGYTESTLSAKARFMSPLHLCWLPLCSACCR